MAAWSSLPWIVRFLIEVLLFMSVGLPIVALGGCLLIMGIVKLSEMKRLRRLRK